ncbi:U32 family peptidase [Clostridia bacterium]|nr:U32 family peptidase [Clostridia bacterium]
MTNKRVELLLPAGNMEKMKTAFLYGADAVYLGGPLLGLRAKAGNFTLEELSEAIRYAHDIGKKVYITTNIYAQNRDLDDARSYFRTLATMNPDALLISDFGLMRIAKQEAPLIPIHVSTQANVTNYESCLMYEELGASCVVLARELNIEEIQDTVRQSNLDIEIFAHGAMCMSYSGRCMLSMFMTNRSANRGECTHPCRWQYHVVEEQRPGEYLPVEEDERGTYIFNSKDLCTINDVDRLIEAGVSSLKIEGRMKSVHYVATVCKAYRQAIDAYYQNPESYQADEQWIRELKIVSDRDYCTGFLFGSPTGEDHNYGDYDIDRKVRFCAKVIGYDEQIKALILEQRNRFFVGDNLEIVQISGPNSVLKVDKIIDDQNQEVTCCPHPRQIIRVPYEKPLPEGTLIRVCKED